MKSVSNCAIFENKVHCLRLILKLDEIALERLALNFAGNLEWLGDNLLGLQNSEKWEFTLENRCRYNRKETSELSEKRSSLEGPDGDERRWQEKNSQAMHRYVDDMFLPRKGPKWTSCPKPIFFHDRLWNNAFIVSIHLNWVLVYASNCQTLCNSDFCDSELGLNTMNLSISPNVFNWALGNCNRRLYSPGRTVQRGAAPQQ